MTRRAKVLYCTTNRYRTYNRLNYEALADRFDLRVVWISPPPPNEPVPDELARRIRAWVLGEDPRRLRTSDVVRSTKFLRLVMRESRGCDLIVAPPAGSWKTRMLYVASRINRVPLAVRSDTWRDGDGLLRTRRRSRPDTLVSRVQQELTAHIERTAAALLVNGSKGREYLSRRGVPAERVFTFRRLHPDLAELPVDDDLVARVRAAKGSRIAFLYLGRIMHQKGLVPLVRVFRDLFDSGRDALLYVVGGPIEKDSGRGRVSTEYLEEARRLAAGEPRIVFVGPVPPAVVHNYYAACDVFVHPHVASYDGQDVHEPWGNVITEAASMRMPIVVSDRIPAGFDIVEPGVNGYRVQAEHLEPELAAALARFIDDPETIAGFGEASRRAYEAFANPDLNNEAIERVIDRRGG